MSPKWTRFGFLLIGLTAIFVVPRNTTGQDDVGTRLQAEQGQLRVRTQAVDRERSDLALEGARLERELAELNRERARLLSQNSDTNPNFERDTLAHVEKMKRHKAAAKTHSDKDRACKLKSDKLESDVRAWAERYEHYLAAAKAGGSGPAATKPKSVGPPPTETTKRYLIFCGREKHTDRLPPSPGHAFIGWGEDNEQRQACVVEAFGFYPSSTLQGVISLIKPVDGRIADLEFKKAAGEYSCKVVVPVTREVFEATQRMRAVWQDEKYQILGQNCISFVDAVARKAGLKTPERTKDQLPMDYINQLSTLNSR